MKTVIIRRREVILPGADEDDGRYTPCALRQLLAHGQKAFFAGTPTALRLEVTRAPKHGRYELQPAQYDRSQTYWRVVDWRTGESAEVCRSVLKRVLAPWTLQIGQRFNVVTYVRGRRVNK